MADEIRTHTHVTERTTIPVDHTSVPLERTTVPIERRDLNRQPWYSGANREPAAAIRRVSWAAVFAGVVVALVVQLLLSLLGIGIGASTMDPLQDQNPASGLATRAGIWFMASSLVAVFLGGWVAGRLAGIPRRIDSLLHGVLTWSVATLLLFYLLTSTVGNLIGGTFRVLGAGLSTAATTVAAAAPGVTSAARTELEQRGVDTSADSVRRDIGTLLRGNGAAASATDPSLTTLLSRVGQGGDTMLAAPDRESLVNVVMERMQYTRPQAEETVASFERSYQNTRTQLAQSRDQVAQQAREVAERAAGGITKAALASFVALLIGAIAGALGGAVATPRDVLAIQK